MNSHIQSYIIDYWDAAKLSKSKLILFLDVLDDNKSGYANCWVFFSRKGDHTLKNIKHNWSLFSQSFYKFVLILSLILIDTNANKKLYSRFQYSHKLQDSSQDSTSCKHYQI